MKPKTPATELVERLCREFPEAGTRTLATKAWNEHRKLFLTYEQARDFVRYCRGEHGQIQRQKRGDIIPTTKHGRLMPPSLYRPIEPFVFTQAGAGCIISDLHIPYHDMGAVECALNYAVARKHTDFCIINGDLCDIHSISRFATDPREKDFVGELEAIEDFLDVIARLFKKVYLKCGNHELRYEHYLWHKAPELIGVSDFELPTLLHLSDRSIKFIAENQAIHVGGLSVVHGHEFGRGMFSPVNAARGLFMRGKTSSVCGHFHATSEHTETTMRGKVIATWGLGCLCGLQPKYFPMAMTKWNHGFALLDFDGEQDYAIENKRIVDGKVR